MYQKPKCKCGNELIYWVQTYITIERKITEKGKISKRRYVEEAGEGEGVLQRLRCNVCGEEYEYTFDDKGRYIRGENWD